MTLERWEQVLSLCMRATVPRFITSFYLISWIFMGNYVLLNLFLAILFDGFHSVDKDSVGKLEEDNEIHELRVQKEVQLLKEKDRQLTLYLRRQEGNYSGSDDSEESEDI